ncbi:MAG: DUF2142 domain-containing protein [Clostridium sp.]
MKNNINKREILIGVSFICLTLFTFIFYNMKVLNSINLISAILIGIMISLIGVFIIKKNIKLELKFVVIASVMGCLFLSVTPIFQVADEVVHSFRAYDLAKGRIFYQRHEESMILPKSVNELYYNLESERIAFKSNEKVSSSKFNESIMLPLNKGEQQQYSGDGTSAYTAIAYLPQSIGIFIGNLFNLPVYFVLLLGRISNLVIWILIGYFTLKLMPIKRELMMFIMLLPMGVNQAASLSPDAILNASSFFLVSYIMYLKFKAERVSIKDIILLTLSSIAIVSVKMPYVIISGLVILIPNNKFVIKNNNRVINGLKNIGIAFTIVIISMMVFVLWGKVSSPKVVDNPESSISESTEDSFGYGDAIKHIITNPKEFVKNVDSTLTSQGDVYKEQFIGVFGWLDTKLPHKFIQGISIIILLLLILGDGRGFKVNLFDRFIFLGLGIGLFLVLCAVSLSWYEPSLVNEVRFFPGLQGRYFIPFSIPFFLGFYQNRIKVDFEKYNWIVPSLSVFILCFSISIIYMRFWIDII